MLLLLIACTGPTPDVAPPVARRAGDPDAGWDVIRYGDFVGAGIPKDIWFQLIPAVESNPLDREGESAGIPSSFNLFEAENGVEVVGGLTCMGCHGAYLEGEYVAGLGGYSDFTREQASTFELAALAVEAQHGTDSPEWEAFLPLLRGANAIDPYIRAPVRGVNPAFSMERAAVANRDPDTLEWLDAPQFDIPEQVLVSDVPPWWNVKKKSRLYYSGAGAGDFATLISQISVVALTDAEQFDAIADDMVDVLAWIEQLEAPPYPLPVDEDSAEAGRALFSERCAGCHGTYGDDWTYPDRVIPLAEVGTDPLYALAFLEPNGFTAWLQSSHLASTEFPAAFTPEEGYLAPPLDGVWATPPYLHNGSVPDLFTLLDSTTRPTAWTRTFPIDHEFMGVGWIDAEAPGGPEVYDTSLPGLGNGGHTYGDAFTPAERTAVVDYLRTL